MIGEWAKGFKEKKFAVLAADYVWGRDSGESFEKAVKAQGKTVALSLYAPLGTKDFSPYIANSRRPTSRQSGSPRWVAMRSRSSSRHRNSD